MDCSNPGQFLTIEDAETAKRHRPLDNSYGDSVAFADGLAANWQARQPVGVFSLLEAKHGPKFLQIVPALGGDLVAHPPDFFKNFVFHDLIIPLTRAACR